MSKTPERLLWSRFNASVSFFCNNVIKKSYENSLKIMPTLVGEELEWCSAQTLVLLENSRIHNQLQLADLEKKSKEIESHLIREKDLNGVLRKQFRQIQLSSEDRAWELQEQLARSAHALQQEKDNHELSKKSLSEVQHKLVEVECFLTSEKGRVTLQFEEELAMTKLKIAQLEAEKDDLEIQIRKISKKSNSGQKRGVGKENIV